MKTISYKQFGKHRKKCHGCGKLLDDGEQVIMESVTKEKYYPVKGIMRFTTYYFTHIECS